jgi:hypothetical protein
MNEKIKNAIESRERFINKYITIDFLNHNIDITKTNYKFCVLLSGGLRNFEYTIPWINKFLIDPINADVFFYGWANKDGVEKNKETISKIHNLKNYQINDFNDNFFDFIKDEHYIKERIKCQSYNILQVNNLSKDYEIKNNIQYDFIIRARPDVFFFSTFNDNDILEIKENNKLGIPKQYYSLWSPNTTDTFAMGNREVMDLYCNKYYSVEESFKINEFSPEISLDYHINKNMKHIPIHDIYPTYIIDYPCDLITETMHLSPNFGGLNNTITNRLLYQNDVKYKDAEEEKMYKPHKI